MQQRPYYVEGGLAVSYFCLELQNKALIHHWHVLLIGGQNDSAAAILCSRKRTIVFELTLRR
jgi:hypothetical protein